MPIQSVLLIAVVTALAASCASERSAGTGSSAGSSYCDQMQTESARVQCHNDDRAARNDDRAAARTVGRAAGAGGSHAPGSTGSGHGTHAADANVNFGPRR